MPLTEIVLKSLSAENIEIQGDIKYYFTFNNTTGIITAFYDDPYERTTEVNFTVWNFTNGTVGGQVYHASSNNDTAVFQYLVPDPNAQYKVQLSYLHQNQILGKVVTAIIGVMGLSSLLLPSVYGWWGMAFSCLTAFGVQLSVSQKYAALGSVISTILLIMFWTLELISGYIAIGALGFALLLAFLFFFTGEARKK